VWGIRPGTGGFTYFWEVCNRGKRSIGVDLTTHEGRELVLSLCEDSDVFLTSLLPASRQKAGVDVDDVMARNPRIVYARGSGQGPQGPDGEKGGYDAGAYWNRAGISTAATPPGGTDLVSLPGPAFGDIQSGMALAGGISAALYHRERTGSGVVVDSSLFANGLWAMQATSVGASTLGREVLPPINRAVPMNPLVNHYRTADGRYVMLVMLDSNRHWPSFCAALGRPELAGDERFTDERARRRNAAACVVELDAVFAANPLAHWQGALAGQEGPWAVVQTPGEALRDPQATANGYTRTVEYPDGRRLDLVAAPVQFDEAHHPLAPAPEHGAHTDEVLSSLGMDWDSIVDLKIKGVVN
jgi:crotonobetainyl-CoA:carnitine CoA-transferase CaiB-like acyl-CoA transferase